MEQEELKDCERKWLEMRERGHGKKEIERKLEGTGRNWNTRRQKRTGIDRKEDWKDGRDRKEKWTAGKDRQKEWQAGIDGRKRKGSLEGT